MTMDKTELKNIIMKVPVWDTHTHLDISKSVSSKNIWDIAHYFWFERELQAAGYPVNAPELPEDIRIREFLKAFEKTSNTYWAWTVRRIFRDLFDMEITDEDSVRELNRKLAETSSDPEWPVKVCEKINITRISMDAHKKCKDIPCLGFRPHVIPACNIGIIDAVDRISQADDQLATAEQVKKEFDEKISCFHNQGHKVIRLEPAPKVDFPPKMAKQDVELAGNGNSRADITRFLWQCCFDKINEFGMNVQMFIGMFREFTGAVICTSLNDTGRIVNLHPLFAKYPNCQFQLVNAAELSNLDIVQAARLFPNVTPTGMWWFNYRASTFRQAMQYRLEALPSERSILITSDARQIEWCYGKIMFVKTLLADFLYEQISDGWLTEKTALKVAEDWLYNAAARLYGDCP